MEKLYPIGPASRRAKTSAEWLRRICDSGKLEHFRDASGRRLIASEALDRFVHERRQNGRSTRNVRNR
jgi:hypothetical protein